MDVYNQPQRTPPNNYLALAIITTLFCCQVTGIISIIYASQVNSRFIAGDYLGAEKASKNAQIWCIVSLIIGVLGLIILFSIYGLGFLFALSE